MDRSSTFKFSTVIAIGPMKSGTTWVHDYLSWRGDVILPSGVKETFFFDRNFWKGVAWYDSHYIFRRDALRVEVAPSYFHHPEAPVRMYSAFGPVPVIATLRHPVKRAWSHYLHLRRYGYTSETLEVAIRKFPQILEASRYNICLARWLATMGEDNVNVLWQEDMLEDIEEYTAKLCKLIKIPYIPLPCQLKERRNEGAIAPVPALASLGRKLSYALRDVRMYEIINIAKLLGLKDIFFGKPGDGVLPRMNPEEYGLLNDALKEDYMRLPRKFQHSSIVM